MAIIGHMRGRKTPLGTYGGDVPPNPVVIFDQYLERTKGQYIRKCYLEQDLLF